MRFRTFLAVFTAIALVLISGSVQAANNTSLQAEKMKELPQEIRFAKAQPLNSGNSVSITAVCGGSGPYNVNPIYYYPWSTVTTVFADTSVTVCMESGGPSGRPIDVRLVNTTTGQVLSPIAVYSVFPSQYTWYVAPGNYRIETSMDTCCTNGWGTFYVSTT